MVEAGGDLNTILKRLTSVLLGLAPVAVYLFGSQATGEARPDSDIDLAVLLPKGKEVSAGAHVRAEFSGNPGGSTGGGKSVTCLTNSLWPAVAVDSRQLDPGHQGKKRAGDSFGTSHKGKADCTPKTGTVVDVALRK